MGIILGYVCLLSFCLLMGKALTRRFRLKKADRLLRALHKPLSGVLAVSCLLHLLFVLPLFRTRSLFVLLTGLLSLLLLALLVVTGHRGRENSVMWLRRHQIFAVLLLCVAGHIVSYYVDFRDYQAEVNAIKLREMEIGEIADGTYTGECDVGYLSAKVRVTVADGELRSVTLLEHRNERGQAAEQVLSDLEAKRRFPVDAVSGATNSSKVLLQAVQNALEKGAAEQAP